MQIKLGSNYCSALYSARGLPEKSRKAEKKTIFSKIKADYGLSNIILGIRNITDPTSPKYGVLYDKRSKVDLDDGKKAPIVQPKEEAVVPEVTKVKETTPVQVKPAPVKEVKTKGDDGKNFSPTKTKQHTVEIRTTINGVRKRYGFTTTVEERDKYIAKLKKKAGM